MSTHAIKTVGDLRELLTGLDGVYWDGGCIGLWYGWHCDSINYGYYPTRSRAMEMVPHVLPDGSVPHVGVILRWTENHNNACTSAFGILQELEYHEDHARVTLIYCGHEFADITIQVEEDPATTNLIAKLTLS